MNYGVLLPHMLVFGGVRRYIEIGNVLIARGHEYTVFTPDGEPPRWAGFEGTVKKIGELGGSDLDVLITGTPEYAERLDGSGARAKIFYMQLENIRDERAIVCSGRHSVMANSRGLIRRIEKKYSVRVIDGTGGINTALFNDRNGAEGHSFVDRPMKVMCYGRFSRRRKGTRFVVEAVKRMKNRGYNVELHLFDSLTTETEDPRAGFETSVPFMFYLGLPQKSMPGMYSMADVFVSAEKRAGWNNTAAEAAACGIPLVCTGSGTSDFAVDGKTALVLRTRTAGSIERALKKIYRNPRLGSALGKAAGRKISEFSWELTCDRIEAGVAEILGHGGVV